MSAASKIEASLMSIGSKYRATEDYSGVRYTTLQVEVQDVRTYPGPDNFLLIDSAMWEVTSVLERLGFNTSGIKSIEL
jgi:hypothetical protein